MNLRDLKYLVALAEHRHFRKASEACFISQPALSMQIKKLEESLGVQLLERTTKSVFLTDIGLTIADRARHILTNVEEMQEMAKSAKDPYSGELKLGIFPTLAPYLLPHIIPHLSSFFPKLAFYLIEEKTGSLIKKLKQGKLDAAILALPVAESEFLEIPLFEEEFLLTVPNSHEFAKRKFITTSNLDNQTLFLLEEGHCMRDQTLNFCHRVSASENKRFRATSLETLRHIISTGLGITLMPALAMKPKDTVSYIPFQSPKPKRKIGLCARTSSGKQVLFGEIACQIRKIMRSHKNIVVSH
jgi:LysR family hydrogen peroxide-inducible transcriptional activator